MTVVNEDEIECRDCETVVLADQALRVKRTNLCDDCAGSCYTCGTNFRTDDLTESDLTEERYCDGCLPRCECGNSRSLVQVNISWGNTQPLCPDCRRDCYTCNDTFHEDSDEIHLCSDSGDWRCDNHAQFCESCDEWHAWADECEYHGRGQEIEGYGHTTPSMWLRTPEQGPRTEDPDRYYLGIELEIGTSNMTGIHVKDWAESHLGDRNAMSCKEDSSVNGFEIVTQPMTAEYFEQVDWDGFFEMLNSQHPVGRTSGIESHEHGLHVHIGKVAFGRDTVAMAAYAYLMQQEGHLERIGRRQATGYCKKVDKPVSATISHVYRNKQTTYDRNGNYRTRPQADRIERSGIYAGRDAVNLHNSATIEIRAFRSTRSANELRDAVRVTYIAAEYIRSLRINKVPVNSKALHWSSFAAWVAGSHPEAFPSIAGIAVKGSNKKAA